MIMDESNYPERLVAIGICTTIIFILVLSTWGIYSSVTRDRLFEDRCRITGGTVKYVNETGHTHEACMIMLIPEKDSIIAVK